MAEPHPLTVGRPKRKLAPPKHLLTSRIRRLINLAHRGNLSAASRATGLPYGTVRDLYRGATLSPGVPTLDTMSRAYGIPLDWFTDDSQGIDVPETGFLGYLELEEGAPEGLPFVRRVRIPLAAWSLYLVCTTLAERTRSPAQVGKAPDRGGRR